MKIKEIMTRDLTAVSEDTTLKEAARIMARCRFSGLPVVDDEHRVMGIITEKDIIESAFPGRFGRTDEFFVRDFAVLARRMIQVGERYVRDFMTKEAVCVTEDDTILNAAEIMLVRGLKILPVVREEKLVGVVSRAELCRSLMEEG
ncbi:MAG: CBS domain-containing protein [Actinomycetota bacterium]|nr:CBS domain-containing protein [Actinomycetota bacterium]